MAPSHARNKIHQESSRFVHDFSASQNLILWFFTYFVPKFVRMSSYNMSFVTVFFCSYFFVHRNISNRKCTENEQQLVFVFFLSLFTSQHSWGQLFHSPKKRFSQVIITVPSTKTLRPVGSRATVPMAGFCTCLAWRRAGSFLFGSVRWPCRSFFFKMLSWS